MAFRGEYHFNVTPLDLRTPTFLARDAFNSRRSLQYITTIRRLHDDSTTSATSTARAQVSHTESPLSRHRVSTLALLRPHFQASNTAEPPQNCHLHQCHRHRRLHPCHARRPRRWFLARQVPRPPQGISSLLSPLTPPSAHTDNEKVPNRQS